MTHDVLVNNKPLVYADLRRAAEQFVARWRDADGYERGEAQSFVRGLLAVFGIHDETAALYERRAQRATGGRGYIDALVSGTALFEMKSRGKDLVAAEDQALDYMESLTEAERPRYVITSDFATFRILDLGAADTASAVTTFSLLELPDHVETLGFLAGHRPRQFGSAEQEEASVAAAQLMAELYEEMEKTGYPEHEASVFLVRVLFALYADDAGLWPRDTFTRYLEERTSADGHDLGAALVTLFQVLNKPIDKRYSRGDELIAEFPYVNGALFGETVEIPHFDRAMRDKLLRACDFNWASISPAIFGSLFQAVKTPEARRALGEHYTTETNILKVIRPLFLDELEARFESARDSKTRLARLHEDIGRLRFLDPACGCGNFLIVAYREIRALELRILHRLQELDPARAQMVLDVTELLKVKLTHFYGIELEEWPATIARTAMLLVDHQANQDMATTLGLAPEMLPLVDSSAIIVGNALRQRWEDLLSPAANVYVFGNPPFLGHATRNKEQAQDLRDVWQRDDIGRLDYVSGWYRKALDYFGTITGRWAFVSTNSIVQGEPVPAVFGPVFSAGWRIRFAHRTFSWSSEAPSAAAVHCVVVGFDRENVPTPRLFNYPDVKGEPIESPAKTINAYLVDGPHVLVEQRRAQLSPDLPPVTFGNMPRDGGHLVVEPAEYDSVAADPVASKYLRRYVGARELIHNTQRWCLWLVDLDPRDVGRSPILRDRLQEVAAFRSDSSAASTRDMARTPHLFGQRSQPDVHYICIPRVVSETRQYFTCSYFPPEVIASDANFKAPDPDGYLFGVISSSMFLTWQRTVGGRLKSDLRFSNTIVWNNLPLPQVDPKQRQRIIDAGRGVLAARERYPDRSLAELYSPLAMDPELIRAHDRLDAVVDRAFGATRTCSSEEERQAILFARYADLTSSDQLPTGGRRR